MHNRRASRLALNALLVVVLVLLAAAPALAEEGPGATPTKRLWLPTVPMLGRRAPSMQGPGPDARLADRPVPGTIQDLRLEQPITDLEVEASLLQATAIPSGKVIVVLKTEPVSKQQVKGKAAENAKKSLQAEQQDLLGRIQALDPNAKVVAQVQVVLNAMFVEVDASVLPALALDPAVQRIAPVGTYELDLTDSVPYIGASAVQASGYNGDGVRVAVLDSGIDYTHYDLGGSGNPADFAANDPTIVEPGTFPTAKVVGGYDFVGSNWAGSANIEQPDPDPLDSGPGGGHGTHVADIIGGRLGVAPGVDLYAVKVCSSISTSCSGIALIQGMEFAVDPNGDGDPADAVDIINMSLGSPYGQAFDDDLSAAVDNATAVGVLTVASAGNSGDKPYAMGTPSAANTALSVAQTAMPNAVLPLMEVKIPASIAGLYRVVFQPWSAPLTSVIEAPLVYGNGAGGNLNGCAAFPPGSLAGKVVLVDRGVCGFSIKINNIQLGGGLAGIIGLVAPGDPFEGGFSGGGPFTIPGYMVSQADSNKLKSGLPDTMVRFDPALGIPLKGTVVGSSSRGPRDSVDNRFKPEIGAPGASVSAIYGTGTGTGPFGGTSGAAPMVAGSAALLLQSVPTLSPAEAKARLMNTAETNILNEGAGPLAPISRIGGGEVRVDRAVWTPVAAWDDELLVGGLSFGFVDVSKSQVNLFKTVRVRNYSDKDLEYTVTPTFRFADDQATGAVSVSVPPGKLKVKAGKDATFTVKMTINGAALLGNFMNSGNQGANPSGLTSNEFDGYLVLDGMYPIHLPWHVLPRKAADVVSRPQLTFGGGSTTDVVSLTNIGVGTAQNDAYAWLAESPNLPEGGLGDQSPTPDIRAVGINTYPVPAGFCSANPSFLWAFAVNTWERQAHLLPVSHQFYLDTNQDGIDDYMVLNRDQSGLGTITDGRQLAWVLNLSTGRANAFFYAEHAMNTGNTMLLICAEQIGMSAADLLSRNVNLDVVAQDFYFGGPGDRVEGLTVTPLGERFVGTAADVPGNSTGTMTVMDYGLFPGNTPELGVLLFTNGDRSTGNRGGATQSTETLLLRAP